MCEVGPIRMEKRSYDGYCVGTCREYPGIVVWGENNEELIQRFKEAVPAHEEALRRHGITNEPEKVEVIPIDREGMDK